MPNADLARIQDPGRLVALHETGLLDSPSEEVFDRQTRLAARLLRMPISLVTLLARDHQFLKSRHDQRGEPQDSRRSPLSHSFCQHVVATGEPLVVTDSVEHPLVCDNEAAWQIRAYLGVPLTLASGLHLGALCVLGPEPREWSREDVELLEDLAGGIVSEIELRMEIARRDRLQREMERWLEVDRALVRISTRFLGAPPHAMRASLEAALGEMAVLFGAERALLTLLPANGGTVAGSHESYAWPASEVDTLHAPLADQGGQTILDLLRRLDTVVIEDVASPPPGMAGFAAALRERGLRSALLLPIRRGDLVGVLTFEASAPQRWSEHKVHLLRTVAEEMYAEVQRTATEETLRRVEIRSTTILEAALDAVVTIDAAGCIVDFNPAAEVMFGRLAGEVFGAPMAELMIPPRFRPAHHAGMARHQREGVGRILGKRIEIFALRADGTEFPVELTVTHIPMGDGLDLYAAHIRDITERRRYESELEEARAVADASLRAKDQFLARMSHELRTPLNAVIGISHLLAGTALDEQQEDYLRGIRHSAKLLLALINDLLDLARISSGRLEFETVPFRVAEILRDTVATLKYEADRKDLFLDLVVDPALPEVVSGDPVRLNQVLMNLVGNALKFTRRGGVRVAVAPARIEAEHVTLGFTVSDTGIGIASDRLDAIFEEFTQEKRETAALFGGSGLGLAIVRQLVEAQGGTTSVESEVGRGTTFTVEIPYQRTAALLDGTDDDAPVDLKGARILVVEDNELNRMVTQRTLLAAGAHVETAGDGEEALALMRNVSVDLVLMDLQMPRMSGFETARRIRNDLGIPSSVLPVLALTASVVPSERREVEAAGMDGLILKPCDPLQLIRTVAAHLAGRTPSAAAVPAAADGVLDLERFHQSTLGDAAFTRSLVEIFDRTTPPLLDQLAVAAAAANHTEAAALAHKLTAAAGVIGAVMLQQEAARLEREWQEETARPDPARIERLQGLFEEASRELARQIALPEDD